MQKRIVERACMIALTFLALFAAPASAADQSSAVTVSASPRREITIPFNPPLDQDLRYRVTSTKPRGKDSVTVTSVQSLRFSKTVQGYVMRLTHISMAGKDGVPLDLRKDLNVLPPGLRHLFKEYSFDLDDSGSVLRIRDWEAVRADLTASEAAMAELIESDPAKRADARNIAHAVIGIYTDLTAEQAPGQLIKTWMPLLGNGGTVLEENAVQTFEIEIEAPILNAPVPTTGTVRLSRGDKPGTMLLVQESQLDANVISKAAKTVFERIVKQPLSDPKARENMAKAAEMVRGMTVRDSVEILFDETGLPIRASVNRKMRLPTGEGGDQSSVVERVN